MSKRKNASLLKDQQIKTLNKTNLEWLIVSNDMRMM